MNLQQKLNLIWRKTHPDFKSMKGGYRSVLVLREAGTCLVPLDTLTEAEVEWKFSLVARMAGLKAA